MVIIEGPDNSGKSTLIKNIVRSLAPMPIKVNHSGGPPHSEGEVKKRMDDILKLGEKEPFLLQDRVSCISDIVYGTTLRDGSVFTKTDHLTRLMKSGPIIIYCRPPTMILLKGIANRPVKKHKTPEHVQAVVENQRRLASVYDELMDNIQHINYDWTQSSPAYFSLLLNYLGMYWQNRSKIV